MEHKTYTLIPSYARKRPTIITLIDFKLKDKGSYIEITLFDETFRSRTIFPILDYVVLKVTQRYPGFELPQVYENVASEVDRLIGRNYSALLHARIMAWRDARLKITC